MTMMISKFHKLIQSKVVWYIILTLIVIAFVGLYIKWPTDDDGAEARNSAGMINGEHVPNQEYQNSYANTYISIALAVGGRLNLTGDMSDRLRAAAWKRLITLRKAKELGLTASKDEIISSIKSNPGFQDNKQYNPQRYQAFVNQFLRQQLGISGIRFEDHVREEIILQKLQRLVNQAVLISPFELQRTFSTLIDTFDLEYTQVTADLVKDSVHLTKKDLRDFFKQDPDVFMLPAKVKVKYVTFPVSDYLDDFTFTDDDVTIYYEDHLDDYTETVTVTNQVPLLFATEDGEDSFEDQVQEQEVITPMEEVADEILTAMIYEEALNKALDLATDFVVDIAPDRQGKAISFDKQAVLADKEVYTLDAFSLNEDLIDLKVGSEFNDAAFALRPNPDEYFSDAVAGEENVYVMALEERIPTRVPEFDEVEEQVREVAEAVELKEALTNLVQKIRTDAEKAVQEDKPFASVLKPHGLEAQISTNVSAMTGIDNEDYLEYSDLLLRAAITSNPGEIAEPIELDDDTYLLCYVAQRMEGSPDTFSSYRPRLVAALRQDRYGVNFEAYQEYLLKEANFTENVYEYDDEDEDLEDDEYDDLEDIPEDADDTEDDSEE